jgi:hypothetical protein
MTKTKTTSKKATRASGAAKSDRLRREAIKEAEVRIEKLEGKPGRAKKAAEPKGPKRMSALDAAAKVLAGATEPMRAKDLIAAMEARGLWKSPGGKTPEATLYAAMTREISTKGTEARFKKLDRGTFAAGKIG